MRALAAIALAFVGCSFTFDEDAPAVSLVDEPAPSAGGPRPAIGRTEFFWPMRDPGGDWWVLLYTIEVETGRAVVPEAFAAMAPEGPGAIAGARAARLTGERFDEILDDPEIVYARDRLFRRGPGRVTTWRPGEPWPGVSYSAPAGGSWLFDERAFALVGAGTIDLYRTDGSHQRRIAGERPLFFAAGGDLLVGARACAMSAPQNPCNHAFVHSTRDNADVDLGEIKAALDPASVTFVDETRMILCDHQGLYSVHFDGTGIRTVDTAPCSGNALGLAPGILLCNADGLRRVRLSDGMQDMIDARPCKGTLRPIGRPGVWAVTRPDDETIFACTPLGLLAVPADRSLPRLAGDCTIYSWPEPSQVVAPLDDALLQCDKKGLRRVPYDGGAPTTLDPEPCRLLRTGEWLTLDDPPRLAHGDVWYTRDPIAPWPTVLAHPVFAAPLDGSAPPRVALPADGVNYQLSIDEPSTRSPLHARVPPAPGTYVRGNSGWLDDWRFMERGILPSSSRDGARVRWLEHAANLVPIGELTSAAIPGGAPLRLARNAVQYQEIATGRLVVADNQAQLGPHNRILLIDEEKRMARRLADGAERFYPLDDQSVLVQLVSQGDERSLAVVPLRYQVR